jgi:hypothetical protein
LLNVRYRIHRELRRVCTCMCVRARLHVRTYGRATSGVRVCFFVLEPIQMSPSSRITFHAHTSQLISLLSPNAFVWCSAAHLQERGIGRWNPSMQMEPKESNHTYIHAHTCTHTHTHMHRHTHIQINTILLHFTAYCLWCNSKSLTSEDRKDWSTQSGVFWLHHIDVLNGWVYVCMYACVHICTHACECVRVCE